MGLQGLVGVGESGRGLGKVGQDGRKEGREEGRAMEGALSKVIYGLAL